MEEMSSKDGVKKGGISSPFDRLPRVTGWLSLKVSIKEKSVPVLLISVPKKIVSLATRRNRLKRLIREVFRQEAFFDQDKVYQFRVIRNPGDLGLKEVFAIMIELSSAVIPTEPRS